MNSRVTRGRRLKLFLLTIISAIQVSDIKDLYVFCIRGAFALGGYVNSVTRVTILSFITLSEKMIFKKVKVLHLLKI
ncbi:MAG: hypothetical protein AYK19_05890 [Theionarchaea archaeon DG-70-1]|nr:MAG: hypothetical protein AYK19_05890 [Theionarchaea archaeon DG-70-1]